jgi:hypothetical protein
MWNGIIWLKMEIIRTIGFYKMLGISWLTDQLLASQEGLCYMRLFS